MISANMPQNALIINPLAILNPSTRSIGAVVILSGLDGKIRNAPIIIAAYSDGIAILFDNAGLPPIFFMYKKDNAGKTVMFYNSPVFSDEYAKQFHTQLNGMVEQQLRLSIYNVACFWYTAWVNGGSPDLNAMDDPQLSKQNRKNYKRELKAWNNGKVLNLSLERE